MKSKDLKITELNSDGLIYNETVAKELLIEIYKNCFLIDNPQELGYALNLYIKDDVLKNKYGFVAIQKDVAVEDAEAKAIEIKKQQFKLNYILDMLDSEGYIIFDMRSAESNPYCVTLFKGFTPKGHRYIEYLQKTKYERFISDISSDTWVQLILSFIGGIIASIGFNNIVHLINNVFLFSVNAIKNLS